MPTVLSPRDWNALVDYDQWNDPFTPDDGVALHHGGGSDYAAGRAPFSVAKEIQQLQQWEGYHIYGKGWRGLAYGWGVGQTGTIYRIRGFNGYGAHTGDVDGDGISNNSEIIPIIFVGSGNHHSLSPAAQDSIAWLRQNILLPKSPQAKKLWGHQEITPGTACPGPKLMEYVRANRVVQEDMPLSPEDLNAIASLIDSRIVPQTEENWTRYAIRDTAGNLVGIRQALQFIYRKLEQEQPAAAPITGQVTGTLEIS